MQEIPEWMKTNIFFKKDLEKGGEMVQTTPAEANLVSSKVYEEDGVEYHLPLIDLDIDAVLQPSLTHGHHHLVINKVMKKEDLDRLLRVLVEVGLVQKGILEHQWDKDGIVCLRTPGTPKKESDSSSGTPMDSSETGVLPDPDSAMDLFSALNSEEKINLKPFEDADKVKPSGSTFTGGTPIGYASPNSLTFGPPQDAPTLPPVMEKFAMLAGIASQTGLELEKVITIFQEFEKQALSENAKAGKPITGSSEPF